MIKLFNRLLDLINIHPDKNQRWTLSTLFVVGLLDAYVGPAISKAWVTELPAEWLAFQSLVYSVVGLSLEGMAAFQSAEDTSSGGVLLSTDLSLALHA